MVDKFDLICSLGGSCSVAHNLLIRNLRKFALPFDWTYIKSEDAIYNLAECFKNNFQDFLLRENLQELVGEEYNNSHSNKVQYKDSKTGYYWVNHFDRKIENLNEYQKVKQKIDRRIRRLKFCIDKSEQILFILSVNFNIKIESIQYLSSTLQALYSNKNFQFKVIVFSSKEDQILKIKNIEINYYKRDYNNYDYNQTNYEWAFLDNLIYDPSYLIGKEKKEKILFSINRIKKGLRICILPRLNTVFYVKLYFFGLRLQLSFGKNRTE